MKTDTEILQDLIMTIAYRKARMNMANGREDAARQAVNILEAERRHEEAMEQALTSIAAMNADNSTAADQIERAKQLARDALRPQ